ncbi:MAG: rnhB [Candidatus Saccharibacteria bacterium]|nr:rnhB [Candidatus Saccharibacteria bacterium]
MQTTKIGNKGEQTATEALIRQGYKIVDRNWKTKWAEVDIVAKKDGIMYFVEVKFRGSSRQGDGLDYITDQKLHHMMRAAELWVNMYEWAGEYQLLAAAVDGSLGETDIREIA